MQAGLLDRLITIEQAFYVKNAAGEKVRTWLPLVVNLPARVELPTTRQVLSSQNLVSEVDTTFTIRYRTDITPHEDLRVLYEGRYFRINGVRETSARRDGLLLDCTSRAE